MHTKHVTYKVAYHFVRCPRIPQEASSRETGEVPDQEIRCVGEASTWTIGALNVQADHVHLFLSAPPSVTPAQIAHTLTGTTARKGFQHFPEVGYMSDPIIAESREEREERHRRFVVLPEGASPTGIAL